MLRDWLRRLLIVAAVAPSPARAADPPRSDPPSELELFNLEALLNARTLQVPSKTPESVLETPGVVTVITRDEIVRSGARDLVDLLLLIPGFSFGVDVEGVINVGFRGNWGQEGKVLLLLDGQEMNELLYSSLQLGQHYPADHIQRLEIIRGPGSAIYGGYAELAVINVITRGAKDLNGVAGAVYYGQMEHATGRTAVTLSYGQTFARAKGLEVSLEAFLDRGIRSDQNYVDFSGKQYSMADNSTMQTAMVNASVGFHGLKLRFIFDDHHVFTRDAAGPVSAQAWDQRFQSYVLDLQYAGRINRKLTITPRISYTRQTPWQVTDKTSEIYYDKTVDRLRGNVILSYDILASLNALAGVEGYLDLARLNDPTVTGFQTLFGNSRSVSYGNVAVFAQGLYRNFIANVTLGARYEYHEQFGSSFVPRVALTKVVGRFSLKLLFSQAFRAPAIENINLNPNIKPERTNVLEGELGLRITENMFFTVNGYWTQINQPIIYSVNPVTSQEMYFNADHVGTAGLEAELRLKYSGGYATLNYSFYSSAGQNNVASYQVPGHDDVLLAFPAHKLALSGSINLYRDVVGLSVTGAFMSRRYGYTRGDASGAPVLGSEPPIVLLNALVFYRNVGLRGLDLGVGGSNLIGQSYRLLQPYNSGHAPLPMGSRELFARLAYHANLD